MTNGCCARKPTDPRYLAAQDSEAADALKTPQSLDLLLGIGNGTTAISVVVEDDRVASNLSQKKKPTVANRKRRQARRLRRQHDQGRPRISVENLFRNNTEFFFSILNCSDR